MLIFCILPLQVTFTIDMSWLDLFLSLVCTWQGPSKVGMQVSTML